MIQTVPKQPAEELRVELQFDRDRAVVQLVEIAAIARGLVAGAAALQVDSAVSGGTVTLTLKGGTDGERYLVTGQARLDNDELREAEVEIVVIDAAWTMPDGGAPYLTIHDFVRRFGLPEVVRMTDADGSGRIDRELLVAQLVDAQAVVESHLAGRYQLPLAQPPIVIQKAIADLARASLYPNGAPDGVAEAAKASLRMLESIRDGKLPIASATPLAPAEQGSEPVLFTPGERLYPDGLRDYGL
jgi:phage gp36-like protein